MSAIGTTPTEPSLSDCRSYLIDSGCWVSEDLVEEAEDGELEEQRLHLEVDGDAVEHAGDAVVGVRRVLGVRAQQQHVRAHNGRAGKPGGVAKW